MSNSNANSSFGSDSSEDVPTRREAVWEMCVVGGIATLYFVFAAHAHNEKGKIVWPNAKKVDLILAEFAQDAMGDDDYLVSGTTYLDHTGKQQFLKRFPKVYPNFKKRKIKLPIPGDAQFKAYFLDKIPRSDKAAGFVFKAFDKLAKNQQDYPVEWGRVIAAATKQVKEVVVKKHTTMASFGELFVEVPEVVEHDAAMVAERSSSNNERLSLDSVQSSGSEPDACTFLDMHIVGGFMVLVYVFVYRKTMRKRLASDSYMDSLADRFAKSAMSDNYYLQHTRYQERSGKNHLRNRFPKVSSNFNKGEWPNPYPNNARFKKVFFSPLTRAQSPPEYLTKAFQEWESNKATYPQTWDTIIKAVLKTVKAQIKNLTMAQFGEIFTETPEIVQLDAAASAPAPSPAPTASAPAPPTTGSAAASARDASAREGAARAAEARAAINNANQNARSAQLRGV